MGDSDKRKKENIKNAAIAGGASEVVQRYGSAVKEHIVSYTGVDNEMGKQLQKSLKSISDQKVNPNYKSLNLKQQAGFSAEVKETANFNAEEIIKRSSNRKVRTDDIGRVNDTLYDHVEVDAAGNIIPGSGSQMKFIGNNPKETLSKLTSKKYSKYFNNDAKIDVPKERYNDIINEANEQIKSLEKQVQDNINKGNAGKAGQLKDKIKKIEKVKKNLRESSVSDKEAMLAKQYPVFSTAKSIVKVSHRAGMETAGMAAVIGGSVSIVQNIVALIKDETSTEDAVLNIAKDTTTSAVVGYGTSFVGSAIKGFMQNSASQTTQALATAGLPAVIVNVAIGATKTLSSYFKGDINGTECFEELGEQGTGMISSALFAAVGQLAIPIPVVGGVIGGMLGYALASASYGLLLSSLKEAKLAREERILIERACEEHIKMIKEYRTELEKLISEYLNTHIEIFHNAFEGIKGSLKIGDVDGFISSTNQITKALGKEVLFETQEQCDEIMGNVDFVIKI
ncbi:MAG: hypothetical protein MRZ66_02735 [Clostridiales bacterium]|nr:hypothetical protein [Clostridiales bacterium]